MFVAESIGQQCGGATYASREGQIAVRVRQLHHCSNAALR
jgi:hypothetical protein